MPSLPLQVSSHVSNKV